MGVSKGFEGLMKRSLLESFGRGRRKRCRRGKKSRVRRILTFSLIVSLFHLVGCADLVPSDSATPSLLNVRVEATGPSRAQLSFSLPFEDDSDWKEYSLPFYKRAVVERGEMVAIYGKEEGAALSIYIDGKLVEHDPAGRSASIIADSEAPSLVKVSVKATGPSRARLSFSPALGLGTQWEELRLPFTREAVVESGEVVAIYGEDEGAVLSVYIDDELVKQDPTGRSASVSLARYFAELQE